MKKVLIIICVVAFGGNLLAQKLSSEDPRTLVKEPCYLITLFEKRSTLLKNGESTRAIDIELAKHGVHFPAKLDLDVAGNKTNVTFALIESTDDPRIEQKLSMIKAKIPELEAIRVDSYYCFATFKKGATKKMLNELLAEFLYDGYYISIKANSRAQAAL
ncbi:MULTISPECIES: hypothetical protein [unclassified Imperialibacter]|uniref:hypothetical protein n=1 Tax=unclassified Imperialibacter TaxID=2629706 RepID=UPI0012566E80|nr:MULTISPECIES: hypothetical protein [unclassified Imperialibacter]CAD5270577.1 hypothetical protein IMPERIA75_370010 [Imperialibacter sp. 75]CAD5298873.1 hypothetical protein IMPERIA89_740098 [Imperialibacter sp. 89]VVT35714.1 hypothetical protein IMPR6_90183 [Imperialibacter sp. EC-SDR9]